MVIKYSLPCPCGKKIPVKLSQAGETIRCVCGTTLQIPAMREIKQLEPCDQQSSDGSLNPKATWGRREGQMLLGILMVVIGLGLSAYFYQTRPKLLDISSFSPMDTWILWLDLRNGPDRHLSPYDQEYMERRGINRVAMWSALALASIGLLVLIHGSLMRRRRSSRFGGGTSA
ncbi:MAG: hypothetical protein JW829_11940 [Pirellulales bacterium]|nr:hypothetical protein [Pirellulales bacterium]